MTSQRRKCGCGTAEIVEKGEPPVLKSSVEMQHSGQGKSTSSMSHSTPSSVSMAKSPATELKIISAEGSSSSCKRSWRHSLPANITKKEFPSPSKSRRTQHETSPNFRDQFLHISRSVSKVSSPTKLLQTQTGKLSSKRESFSISSPQAKDLSIQSKDSRKTALSSRIKSHSFTSVSTSLKETSIATTNLKTARSQHSICSSESFRQRASITSASKSKSIPRCETTTNPATLELQRLQTSVSKISPKTELHKRQAAISCRNTSISIAKSPIPKSKEINSKSSSTSTSSSKLQTTATSKLKEVTTKTTKSEKTRYPTSISSSDIHQSVPTPVSKKFSQKALYKTQSETSTLSASSHSSVLVKKSSHTQPSKTKSQSSSCTQSSRKQEASDSALIKSEKPRTENISSSTVLKGSLFQSSKQTKDTSKSTPTKQKEIITRTVLTSTPSRKQTSLTSRFETSTSSLESDKSIHKKMKSDSSDSRRLSSTKSTNMQKMGSQSTNILPQSIKSPKSSSKESLKTKPSTQCTRHKTASTYKPVTTSTPIQLGTNQQNMTPTSSCINRQCYSTPMLTKSYSTDTNKTAPAKSNLSTSSRHHSLSTTTTRLSTQTKCSKTMHKNSSPKRSSFPMSTSSSEKSGLKNVPISSTNKNIDKDRKENKSSTVSMLASSVQASTSNAPTQTINSSPPKIQQPDHQYPDYRNPIPSITRDTSVVPQVSSVAPEVGQLLPTSCSLRHHDTEILDRATVAGSENMEIDDPVLQVHPETSDVDNSQTQREGNSEPFNYYASSEVLRCLPYAIFPSITPIRTPDYPPPTPGRRLEIEVSTEKPIPLTSDTVSLTTSRKSLMVQPDVSTEQPILHRTSADSIVSLTSSRRPITAELECSLPSCSVTANISSIKITSPSIIIEDSTQQMNCHSLTVPTISLISTRSPSIIEVDFSTGQPISCGSVTASTSSIIASLSHMNTDPETTSTAPQNTVVSATQSINALSASAENLGTMNICRNINSRTRSKSCEYQTSHFQIISNVGPIRYFPSQNFWKNLSQISIHQITSPRSSSDYHPLVPVRRRSVVEIEPQISHHSVTASMPSFTSANMPSRTESQFTASETPSCTVTVSTASLHSYLTTSAPMFTSDKYISVVHFNISQPQTIPSISLTSSISTPASAERHLEAELQSEILQPISHSSTASSSSTITTWSHKNIISTDQLRVLVSSAVVPASQPVVTSTLPTITNILQENIQQSVYSISNITPSVSMSTIAAIDPGTRTLPELTLTNTTSLFEELSVVTEEPELSTLINIPPLISPLRSPSELGPFCTSIISQSIVTLSSSNIPSLELSCEQKSNQLSGQENKSPLARSDSSEDSDFSNKEIRMEFHKVSDNSTSPISRSQSTSLANFDLTRRDSLSLFAPSSGSMKSLPGSSLSPLGFYSPSTLPPNEKETSLMSAESQTNPLFSAAPESTRTVFSILSSSPRLSTSSDQNSQIQFSVSSDPTSPELPKVSPDKSNEITLAEEKSHEHSIFSNEDTSLSVTSVSTRSESSLIMLSTSGNISFHMPSTSSLSYNTQMLSCKLSEQNSHVETVLPSNQTHSEINPKSKIHDDYGSAKGNSSDDTDSSTEQKEITATEVPISKPSTLSRWHQSGIIRSKSPDPSSSRNNQSETLNQSQNLPKRQNSSSSSKLDKTEENICGSLSKTTAIITEGIKVSLEGSVSGGEVSADTSSSASPLSNSSTPSGGSHKKIMQQSSGSESSGKIVGFPKRIHSRKSSLLYEIMTPSRPITPDVQISSPGNVGLQEDSNSEDTFINYSSPIPEGRPKTPDIVLPNPDSDICTRCKYRICRCNN